MLDFKNFKKVSEDKHTVTMKHNDGHKISIVMKALPKIQQEQIKRLKLADGTPPGGAAQPDDSQPDDRAPNSYANDPNAQAPVEQSALPNESPVTAGVAAAQDPNASNIPIPSQLKNVDANGQPIPGAVQANSQNAEDLKKNVAVEAGKARADLEMSYIDQRAAIAQRDMQNLADVKKHTDDFANYMAKNPNDPHAFQNNMSAPQRVNTGIALFLGGFKSGLVGGSNPAMDFLNQQIDRDIAGQKERANQQRTVWGAYHDLYGDSVAANSLAKASMIDMYNHKITQQAAQLGTPTAIANAMAAKAELSIKREQELKNAVTDLSAHPGQHSAPVHPPTGQEQAPGPGAMAPKPVGVDDAYRNAGVDPKAPDRDAQLQAQGRDPQKYLANYVAMAGRNGPSQASQQHSPQLQDEHILSPTADKDFERMQFNPTKDKNYDSIRQQKTSAALADKALDTINTLYPEMAKSTGGESGFIRRQLGQTIGHVPFLGQAGEGISNALTRTPENISYESNKSQIVGAVRGALQGNVSEDLLDKTVNTNLPETDDTPEIIKKKHEALKEFIRSHTKTDLLDGLLNKKKN